MARPKQFSAVKLVCGLIFGRDDPRDDSKQRLEGSFGPIDLVSPCHVFDLTDYYEEEMGSGLRRMFLSFEHLVRPEDLAGIKLRTNALEEEVRLRFGAERRVVNLDPGYLTAASLIMATAKDFSHRIPLQNGIYAHLEFLFRKNGIRPLAWTYPDLTGDRYTEFFLASRRIYLAQLAAAQASGRTV